MRSHHLLFRSASIRYYLRGMTVNFCITEQERLYEINCCLKHLKYEKNSRHIHKCNIYYACWHQNNFIHDNLKKLMHCLSKHCIRITFKNKNIHLGAWRQLFNFKVIVRLEYITILYLHAIVSAWWFITESVMTFSVNSYVM